MKNLSRMVVTACVAFGAAACAADVSPETDEIEANESTSGGPAGYHVFTLSGLGGTSSAGNGINDLGFVAGVSNIEVDAATHAVLWVFGLPLDLGTLGGPNSSSAVIWPVKNVRGVVSGITEVPGDDPFHEEWSCSAFIPKTPGHICRGFVWEGGEMRALPTLGGTHGFATGTNNRRQTVGWAEKAVRDSTCNQVSQFLQFSAVLWGPGRDQIQELPPLPGDTTSAATVINDRGVVAGISGICSSAVGEFSARHAVRWDNGVPRDLGSLGGVAWNTPMAMNERGDIVGFANAPGTEPPSRFNYRAFLWTEESGRMRDLGALPGDARSQALGINARRQVVGMSRGAGFRGFVWENGVMTDLNDLIVSGSRDTITSANDINAAGVITGVSVDAGGASHAFVAVPIRRR